jgi:Zn-dependent metalloprotease
MFRVAYWNGSEMTYGDGGDRLNALSMDADVVGHEFVRVIQ